MAIKKVAKKKKVVDEKKEPKEKITNQYLTEVEGKVDLPDGSYKGVRNGYDIVIKHEGKDVKCKAVSWTERPDTPCLIMIKKGKGKLYSAFPRRS